MIYKTSSYLSSLLQKKGIISESQIELYEYGFQITIANFINFAISFLTGILFHSVMEAALFYFVFVSLRFFCGGYHADSYERCFVLFAVTNIACLFAARILSAWEGYIGVCFFISVLWLAWSIWMKAPVEHPNRPLSRQEKFLFKRRAIQTYCFWTGTGIILLICGFSQLAANLISTFIAVTIVMF